MFNLNGPHRVSKPIAGGIRLARPLGLLIACGLFCHLSSEIVFGQTTGQSPAMAREVRSMRKAVSTGPDALRRPASGTYDVIALLVEFAPDTSRFTSGTGTFAGDPFDGLEPVIDPLPHDAAYFEAHLDFLQHYVDRVSDGRVAVETHLIPEVVRVPNPMRAYAPTGPDSDSDAELSKLAALVVDAWSAADAQVNFDMSGFPPEKTALAIFHAGVGRDIELIGTTLDKTPQDLPSLFFDEAALERLGASGATFQNFPVRHTMILPRTETRVGMDFVADESFLLELSINGLLAASFFNFLGAPDLFDTETGESAIGPFGLMDGQGIFAYRGLFPPEPTAWTKYFLGWTEPVLLNGPGPVVEELSASSRPDSSPSAMAVVSDAEYFLVENRYRDPEGDGLTLHVWKDGSVVEQHVENGDPDFNSATVEGYIGGVVVGVDNYDWALPGGIDEDENELNGGILIWHVDERRLRAGFADNRVNVGVDHRGIDLEEADGAQDIGFPSGPFGPQAELGSPFDFFYEGNPVRVETAAGGEIRLYENRFGPGTYPGSETNAGGPSFVVLEGFSAAAATMTFEYRREGIAGIEPLEIQNGAAIRDTIREAGMKFGGMSSVSFAGDVPVFYSESSSSVVVGGSTVARFESLSEPVTTREGWLITLQTDPGGRISLSGVPVDPAAGTSGWSVPLPEATAGMKAASPLVRGVFERAENFYVVLKDEQGSSLVVASRDAALTAITEDVGEPVGIVSIIGDLGSSLLVVGRKGAGLLGQAVRWSFDLEPDAVIGRPVFGRENGSLLGAFSLVNRGELWILRGDGSVETIDVASEASRYVMAAETQLSSVPVLVDLDSDGRLDVLTSYGSHLFAFSQSGAVVEGFPVHVDARVRSQPLVARLEGEEGWTIFAAAEDGYVYAYDESTRPVSGFPLEVGDIAAATPAFDENRLFAVSSGGTVKSWELSGLAQIWWGGLHGSGNNESSVVLPGGGGGEAPPDAPLIDEAETYNWPNPIQNGSTHLRIRTARDARVQVTILDAGGGLVDEISLGRVSGGIPTEIVWQADVQSGLYFARFTATAEEGSEQTKVVKMAVIR